MLFQIAYSYLVGRELPEAVGDRFVRVFEESAEDGIKRERNSLFPVDLDEGGIDIGSRRKT